MLTSNRIRSIILGLGLAAAGATTLAAVATQRPAAGTTPADEGKAIEATNGVVTSANALASEAGVEMLRGGGNAVDAVVAAAFAIGVVEPQMSGLGGGGAAIVWMKRDGNPAHLDFYSAQPADSWKGHTEPAPTPGQPSARQPGDLRGAAIPGEVPGLLALHEKFGSLSRDRVMAPAIRLAEEGFPIGQILADFIRSGEEKMKPFPKAYALYFPQGKQLGPGATLRNPELAESLRRIAREGRRGFEQGPIAQDLIETLNAGKHPARLVDLADYQPQWKRPVCTDYRGRTVLSAAPSEGGLQVLHTLELLEPFDLKSLGLPTRSAAAFDVLVSALRVGQADARGNADPRWAAVPANGISSSAFAGERKPLVGTGVAAKAFTPGDATLFDHAVPPGECARYETYGPALTVSSSLPPSSPQEIDLVDLKQTGETTHISVVDKEGNAVALTQTIGGVWGSGGFTQGFFLNSTGFRFTDDNIDAPSRSRWRVWTSTISPTIVLQGGNVQMVIGAPGGNRIPTEIVQVMVYALDYGMDPLNAVKMPRIFPSPEDPRVQLEHGFAPQLLREVTQMGYEPVPTAPGYARLYMILRRGDSWIGVADPRHDGEPRGY